MCSVNIIGFSPNMTRLLGWGFWTIQQNIYLTKVFFLREVALASRKLNDMTKKIYALCFNRWVSFKSRFCHIFRNPLPPKKAVKCEKSRSHVCNLDVIASPTILLPQGILRKAGKEEEKPWEINLMARMGSVLVCVLLFLRKQTCMLGFLLFQSKSNYRLCVCFVPVFLVEIF